MATHFATPQPPPDTGLACCGDCGTVQRLPAAAAGNGRDCAACGAALERSRWRSLDAALATSVAALLLLAAGNLLPFLTTSILGASRRSYLITSASAMLDGGYPELAVVTALCTVVLPLLRFALLGGVLATLRFSSWRPRQLGPAFRWANVLQTWAMADVFLLGTVVAWARMRSEIPVEVGLGAWCYGAGALAGLLARATLDIPAVWRAIAPDRPAADSGADAAAGADAGAGAEAALACDGCGLVVAPGAAGTPCPRCQHRLHRRKPGAVRRAAALTLAGALLYLPANLYPIATLPIDYEPVAYTVLVGVIDLVNYHLYGLAAVVLLASFVVPLLKLAGMAWCIASVLRRSRRHLVAKSRLFRVIDEIGRWSMVDPFTIACFVPVMDYHPFVVASAEAGAPAFAGVVVLTVLAAHAFDPRLMWDAAGRPRPARRPVASAATT